MRRLFAPLAATPATLPALLAVGVFAVWSADQAGYPVSRWAPGTLLLLVLLAMTVIVVPPSVRSLPRWAVVAMACLAAFTLWSYASIAWADDPGDAWNGANRTLLYLVCFLLFAGWAQRQGTATLIIGTWTAAMVLIAVVVLITLPGDDPLGAFMGERLAEPAGYPNASAAQWMLAFFPAVILASRAEIDWWARAGLAGGAVVLADLALMTQSRGMLYSTPIVVAIMFLVTPGRVRVLLVLAPVALGVLATAAKVLDVGDGIGECVRPTCTVTPNLIESLVADARGPVFLAALVVALTVAAGIALLELARPPSPEVAARASRVIGAAAIGAVVVAVVVALAAAGGPFTATSDAWHSFKRGYEGNTPGDRLTGGLGSNRYDFYRVAWGRFEAHPILGVGADNFRQDYLLRRSDGSETPRYPHSVEFRTISQLGIVGALLLFGAVAGVALAAVDARRRAPPLGAAVAAAGLTTFAYFLVHGSFDWFWEFAGLGAPAWAMAGLACSLAPRATEGVRPLRVHPAVVVLLALPFAVSLALPWLAERDMSRGQSVQDTDPRAALDDYDAARKLNFLSEDPDLLAGTLLVREGDLDGARRAFERAQDRAPRDAYAALELGAIASAQGNRPFAITLLRRALALNPRDSIARVTLRRVATGGRVDVQVLNEQLQRRARRATR
jgi:O-Antigen ligase/Tetratricopeptide repeat